MLGLSRKQAMTRFDHVVAFAELEGFMDLRLKNYSSGMLVRLAFATAIQVDAEILLIDEVLAVGDAAFQQKCFEEFFRLKREGRTIVFVSHDMFSVERFCDRAMLMEHGHMTKIGDPREIGRAYHELNFGQLAHDAPEESHSASGTAIADAWFEKAGGERVTSASQEDSLSMCFEARLGEDLARARVRGHAAHRARPHDHRRALGPARPLQRLVQSRRNRSSQGSRYPTG